MTPTCAKCYKEFDEYGALIFSPPVQKGLVSCGVSKFHICPECYDLLIEWLNKDKDEE